MKTPAHCPQCQLDITHYKPYEQYSGGLCEKCHIQRMEAIPLENLGKPDFTLTLNV